MGHSRLSLGVQCACCSDWSAHTLPTSFVCMTCMAEVLRCIVAWGCHSRVPEESHPMSCFSWKLIVSFHTQQKEIERDLSEVPSVWFIISSIWALLHDLMLWLSKSPTTWCQHHKVEDFNKWTSQGHKPSIHKRAHGAHGFLVEESVIWLYSSPQLSQGSWNLLEGPWKALQKDLF